MDAARTRRPNFFCTNCNIYHSFFPSRTSISSLDVMEFLNNLKVYYQRALPAIHLLSVLPANSYIRKNFWNPSYFFKNILSIYICILGFRFYLVRLLVYKYIYLIYFKKSMTDFRNFSLLIMLMYAKFKFTPPQHAF